MLSSRLFAAAILIMLAAFLILATSCFGNSTPGATATVVMAQPQVESVLASTSGTHSGYYATLDIKVKNNGAEGTILVEASVTQNGQTNSNEMPVYLQQGEEHELKLTFPLVWKGGDFTCNVQAVLPSAVSTASSSSSSASSTPSQNTLFSAQTFSQIPSQQSLIFSFTPNYPGYINISGTSSSATGYIMVVNATNGASNTYTFSTGTAISAPLTTGNTYMIYFGNRDSLGTITATLSGTYSNTPSGSFPSSQNTLFSAQTLSQIPSQQSLVFSFTPTYTGYINISGTSSSTSGYIVVVNATNGVSNTYTFGMGTAVTAPLTAGNTYMIYFGNHDSAGTITASLSGTYQP